MMHPNKFLLKRNMGWKKSLEKFQECCLVHDHILYLSGMKEAFLGLSLA